MLIPSVKTLILGTNKNYIGWLSIFLIMIIAPVNCYPEVNLAAESYEYQKITGISGNLSSVGSDTLANMMSLWAEAFRKLYPKVHIQIQAAGSSTAPPALTEGTAQFGPMTRSMKPNEIYDFEKKYGYHPTRIKIALDALAIFVHQDNPLKKITIKQLDSIFSVTHKCGAPNIVRWGQLGLTGKWQHRDFQLYGRNSASGTYGYFKQKALCKGDFKAKVNEQLGSASVVQSISQSVNAIGYSSIGYRTAGVKALSLSRDGNKYYLANSFNAANGNYPLARYLYLYINKPPNKALRPMIREFIKFILSNQGQKVVLRDGYVPIPHIVITHNLKILNISH